MTKTLAPAKLSITTTKTSLNSTQPRYTSSLLATQRSSTTNTSSSIRNGSARLQNTSRLPAAVHGSAGQPVDSLSSSPLSPSMSNSRTSTTSDSISERSIPSSSISKLASTTNGRSSKIDSVIPGRRSLTATARSKTSTSSSSTILDAPVTSKSRLSAPKVSQFSSTLPKLVATKSVVNQNTSSPRVQTAASAQCDKSSSLKTSNSSCSKIRQLKQPTGIESVNRAISRVTPIIPASKISNRPKGNGLPKPPVCMGGRLNNLVAVVRPQQQQQQPAQQDDKRGEDVPVTRSNATTKACLSSAEVVVVGRQQELEHEAAARLTSVGAPTTIKLKTTQRRGSSGSKREEDHGAKNEAANLNHKDVNSPTEAAAVTALEAKEGLEEGEAIEEATARTTTTSTVNNQNCLTNNLRDQQDEKERPREKDDEGLVSGHEVVCASKECKQDEDGRGESCLGSGEDVSERTTSGCNGQNGPKKIRPDILVSISPSASSSPRPLVTVPTMAISLEPSSSSLLPPPSSVRGNKSTPASETKSLTTKKNDKDGQNGGVPATDSQIASSSAGSSGGGGKLSDIKQHEKRLEQQINKCLSSQHAHTRMPKLQQKQHDDDLANSNKCLHNNKMGKRGSNLQQPPPRSLDSRSAGKHEIGSDSLCSKSTIRSTRAAAASSSATTTNLCGLVSGMDAHSISASHVVSKPMGHRVLSLMMLDAGLVPAGRDQPTNETRKSHVCLQSEPLTLEQPNRLIEFPSHINDLGDNNNNDADLDIEHETSKSNAPSSQMITNRVDANNCIENTNLYLDELALNCGFDQPRNQANCIETSIEQTRAAARLERFSLFGFQSESIVRGASISLPSSPRLPRASQRRAGANDPSQQQRLQPPASDRKFEHLDLDHAQLINERKSYQRATERWYSPVRKCSVTTTTSEPASTKTNLTCDDNNRRLEIHSATSSCSSLNSHCPPMLSLSNQLDAMEFSRMIKANVDRVSRSWAANRDQHQQQNHEIRLVSAAASTIPLEVNDSKTEVFQSRSQLEIRPQPQQSSSPDRTEQIHKLPYQRPLLLCDESDLTCDGSKDNLSSKIDRLDALRRATEKMRASGFNESELESSGNNRSTHQLGLDKECSIGSPPPANTTRQAVSSNADEIKMLDQQSGLLKLEPRPR